MSFVSFAFWLDSGDELGIFFLGGLELDFEFLIVEMEFHKLLFDVGVSKLKVFLFELKRLKFLVELIDLAV